jgi:hypothetical protein
VVVLIIHVGVIIYRASTRVGYVSAWDAYTGVNALIGIDWPVWVAAAVVMPLIGVLVSIELNNDDDKAYRRYLQFLRLEFDTRLGMHSPR